MNIQKIRVINLLELAKKYNGLKNLALSCGKNNSYFSQIFNGIRPFTEKFARQIEQSLNLSHGYLDSSNLDAGEVEVIKIPEYDIKVSAGMGTIGIGIANNMHIIGYYPLDKKVARIHVGDNERLCIITVHGDSMIPLLQNGSKVLIDSELQVVIDNKIYAFILDEKIYIKRLFNVINDEKIIIRSDNNSYPEQIINNSDMKLIGRAICSLVNVL